MSDLKKLRHQLLQRLVAGEIGRQEYEYALTEIATQESQLDTASVKGQSPTQRVVGAKQTIHPGMEFGSHTVMRLLGKGGMGEVWLTSEMAHVSNFYSVIKLLPADDDNEMKRVLDTFHKVRLLQHEHICPVYSLGHDDRVGFYFVMKYVEGITLQARAKLSHEYLLEVLSAVARALDYAHSRNIVHRDVKPSNIMVNRDLREVNVVDFGLAAHVRHVGSTINGTPKYMAPEQWRGDAQDGKTDQFSLGVVAYELFSGSVPFAESQPVGKAVNSTGIPSIDGMGATVNAALFRSMAEVKEDRFSSCVEFVNELGRGVLGHNFGSKSR